MYHKIKIHTITTVSTLPGKNGKPGILSFTFPGLENAWNLLKRTWNFNPKPGRKT